MIPVKTLQKYKCDFCKKRSVKHIIALHEKRCFRNPNRFCDYCKNTGKATETDGTDYDNPIKVDCRYCAKFDKKMLKEIREREMDEVQYLQVLNNQ